MEITVDGISKTYKDKKAVNYVSFKMQNGVYGLLGVNGAGKTTLMKMLCGIIKCDEGRIFIDGEDIQLAGSSYMEKLGYLPQEFGYYPEFTAREYLKYIAVIKGISKNKINKKIQEVLQIVSLEDVADKKIKTFSGGMKRRIGIGQAIINDPKLLIMDEPTVGLDPKERIRFRKLLTELAEDRIVLLSTHIVSDVEAIAETIFLMKEGKIVVGGKIEMLLSVLNKKVWKGSIPINEYENYEKRYLITNSKGNSSELEVRIISDEKPSINEICNVEPSIEDLFMYYSGHGGIE